MSNYTYILILCYTHLYNMDTFTIILVHTPMYTYNYMSNIVHSLTLFVCIPEIYLQVYECL